MPIAKPVAMPIAATALVAIVVAGLLTVSTAPAAPADSTRRIILGGVSVRLDDQTRQVITVHHTHGWHAGVTLWRKSDGQWVRRLTAYHGRTGYGGLVRGDRRVQGSGSTPLGTYPITESFGNAARPAATAMPYHRVRRGDFWVQDNASPRYNSLRNKRQGGFRWWLPTSDPNSSERLRDYRHQYAWSIVIDYNRPGPVRRRGSGIFLHVNGAGATAGCVSTPRWFVRKALARLRPGLHPVIAIGA